MWLRAVFSAIDNSAAISRFDLPWATSRSTSTSWSVSPAGQGGCEQPAGRGQFRAGEPAGKARAVDAFCVLGRDGHHRLQAADPQGSPHPGAQLNFTDSDGLRVTAFITDTPPGVVPGQLGGLELRHRQHARVEDRIRQAKATGLRNLPCHRADANAAWLEVILAATDLVAWTKLIGFTDHPKLATCEIHTFRYPVLHVAARITRAARQIRLRIDATWRWGSAISQAWQRLRAAFP
jgi:hypothetical protein